MIREEFKTDKWYLVRQGKTYELYRNYKPVWKKTYSLWEQSKSTNWEGCEGRNCRVVWDQDFFETFYPAFKMKRGENGIFEVKFEKGIMLLVVADGRKNK